MKNYYDRTVIENLKSNNQPPTIEMFNYINAILALRSFVI